MAGLAPAAAAASTSTCHGGQLSRQQSTTTGNGGGTTNPAQRTPQGSTTPAPHDGTRCIYGPDFVSASSPLTVSLVIPGGVHIFEDSLFVGQNVSSGAAPQEGEGPTLTIQAGATLAFTKAQNYLLINRGSKIVANGLRTAPITFTGYTDAVAGSAGPEDVQLWGGIVINGNGITNNCTDEQRSNNDCHVVSEGQPTATAATTMPSSGVLLRDRQHAGFESRRTAIERHHLQCRRQQHRRERAGLQRLRRRHGVLRRAARNAILLYVAMTRWISRTATPARSIPRCRFTRPRTATTASTRQHRLLAQWRQPAFDLPPVTSATVRNFTCIVSNNGRDAWRLVQLPHHQGCAIIETTGVPGWQPDPRQGRHGQQPPFRPESTTGLLDAQAGLTSVDGTVLACETASGSFANADTFLSGRVSTRVPVDGTTRSTPAMCWSPMANPTLLLLEEGTYFTVEVRVTPPAMRSPYPRVTSAVYRSDDWTFPWAYGLRDGNRGRALWFSESADHEAA